MTGDLTVRVPRGDVNRFTRECLLASGLNSDQATSVTDVYDRANLRGLGHHDVSYFPRRLDGLARGSYEPGSEPQMVRSHGALAWFDGSGCLGELCATRALEAAMDKAETLGMGLATVAGSAHFLAGYPYVERAVERGLTAIVMTKAAPTMSVPGGGARLIGNNPFGFGTPSDHGAPLIVDTSWAYVSQGALGRFIETGQAVPSHWGSDRDGRPTPDAAAIREGATSPIGGHKGMAMAMVVEVLTGLLADSGVKADEVGSSASVHAQTVMVIDARAMGVASELSRRTTAYLDDLHARTSGAFTYPGQRSWGVAQGIRADGVAMTQRTLQRLHDWAVRLEVAPVVPAASADDGPSLP